MTTAQTKASAEVTATDTAARWPLLLLLVSAIKWLVLSGILSLIASIQLVQPAFLADCSVFTHGRVVALQESVFVYGWAANSGLALALFVLSRLGGSPLRAGNWIIIGTLFWNVAIALGLIGIATGDATSIAFLQLPRYVQLLMVVAYGAISVAGVLAWAGRRAESTFAAQWYAVAALFLFPWLFTAAQMMLLWSPLRGVLQAVAGGWYAQGAWTLWLAPMALASAYYIVPKVTGRALPSYEFAPHAFWCLLLLGAFTGGRHLVGGPVPAWIASVAIVSCTLLLFHYFVVFLNLRGAFGGGGTALKFISFGLAAYFLGGLVDAVTAFRDVAVVTQFTHFDAAQQQLALYGGFTLILFGAIYYAVPRLTGLPWSSSALITGHRFSAVFGVALLVLSLAGAGWIQGHDLLDPKISFADIANHTRSWLLVAVAAHGLLLLGNLVFFVSILRSVFACLLSSSTASAETPFRDAGALEAPVS
jgi:cytochrome c oxidase cbb3-type subunit 1